MNYSPDEVAVVIVQKKPTSCGLSGGVIAAAVRCSC